MGYLLTIAGHDPVHGAGITADLAAWAALGLDGASVVTALTVQNSLGVQRIEPVSAAFVRDALQAVLHDGEPLAIKVGLTGSAAVMREVTAFVAARRCPVVVDPVLAASNGHAADGGERGAFLEALRELLHHADVVTPNVPEAAALLGGAPVTLEALRSLVRGAVVLKGGHEAGDASADRVHDGDRTARLSAPRLPTPSHGTGCVFSAVLAGMLARGWDVFDAAAEARLRVQAGIDQARATVPGRPHTHAAARPDSRHLPTLAWHGEAADGAPPVPFPPLPSAPGFYPVVPDAAWVERLLDWGVRTVQLRVKAGTLDDAALRAEVARAVAAGRAHPGAQVFINDHVALAIELQAFGVHLGQEDLDTADLNALRRSGLHLGVSTHTPGEISRAHAVAPSYLAIGPIYPTTLKVMRQQPVGLQQLRDWAARCQPRYPVVAIGGIDLARAPGVWACGVDGLAVVSAVTQASDPRAAAEAFLRGVPEGSRGLMRDGGRRG